MSKQSASEEPVSVPRPVLDPEECKGCGRCVNACPRKVLRIRSRVNHRGTLPAEYAGEGCTGCGICFYNCPEPYAIRVETPAKPGAGRSRGTAGDVRGK